MKFIDTTLPQFMVEGAKRYHSEDFRYQIVYNPIIKDAWVLSGPRVKMTEHPTFESAVGYVRLINKKPAKKRVICAKEYQQSKQPKI